MLIIELGRQSATHSQLRPELANLLESRDFPPSMRAECAFALGRRGSDSPLLLRTMEKEDEDIMVRAACASALATAAASDHAVRDKLLNIVMCETSAPLRRGAAQGLTRSVARDPRTAEILLGLAKRNDTLEDLKWACAAALTSQLKHSTEVANAFGDWLASSPDLKLRRIAAQALGNAMASDEIPWDRQAVERIEYVLTTLADPCPHALETLEALATVREVRRCLRLEGVLRDVFKPFRERINLVFIYGSTARKRQGPESDIDLMVIGNVTLKDVSLPLRDAERTLGRRINPALYSRDAFQQKYQAGDPFLADVYRREKIALIPSDEKDLEDELRRMVSDCELAS